MSVHRFSFLPKKFLLVFYMVLVQQNLKKKITHQISAIAEGKMKIEYIVYN